jgi:hypothetical protein
MKIRHDQHMAVRRLAISYAEFRLAASFAKPDRVDMMRWAMSLRDAQKTTGVTLLSDSTLADYLPKATPCEPDESEIARARQIKRESWGE